MVSTQRSAMAQDVERTMRTIFKRCLQCPPTTPSCPSCKSTEICSLVPQACDTCAYMTCIANPNPSPSAPRTNVGAIAGGVIGGIAVVAVAVFLVWHFWIKKRRAQQELEAEEWAEDDIASQKRTTRFNAMHSDAVSTRTRASLATSILSRASNIIQIAYIPGVTNRNGSGRDSILQTHPVPPIPAALRGSGSGSQPPKSPLSNDGDMLFFSPKDLRGSTYSGTSSLGSAGNRDTHYTQYSRQSITPSLARSSMASTIYHDNAIAEPMPAMPAARAIPRVVAVKNSPASTPAGSTPGSEFATPLMASDHAEFAANTPLGQGKGFQIMMPGQTNTSSPASSQMSGASFTKATQVNVGGSKGKGRFPIARQSAEVIESSARHMPAVSSPLAEGRNETSDDDDVDEHARARKSLLNATEQAANATPPVAQPSESPFFDASDLMFAESDGQSKPNPYASMASTVGSRHSARASRGVSSLSAVMEANSVHSEEDVGGKRDHSPFSDQHATE